ncbi:MAG: hypothetical protein HZC42_09825 [Candidatus Eisenbacteria bacterium]|nr:hypothetical protein [Candidatus Eisenbacteria bacterium]
MIHRSTRRPLAALVTLVASVAPLSALPTTPAAAGIVVLLKSGALDAYDRTAAGFLESCRSGVMPLSLADGDPAALERRVLAARPDAVVAVGLKAALFARDRLPRLPLVFCVVPNFERFELAAAWVTGVSSDVPPVSEIDALRGVAPDVKRIGLFYGRATGADLARRARAAADETGITLIGVPIASLPELPKAARGVVTQVDALWMPADPTVATPEAFHFLLDLSLEHRKPLLVFSESLVRAGALLAVSPDYGWMGASAAEAVRRIQSGDRAGDIAVAPLRRTRVILNQATARALGRDVPPEALHSAEVVR